MTDFKDGSNSWTYKYVVDCALRGDRVSAQTIPSFDLDVDEIIKKEIQRAILSTLKGGRVVMDLNQVKTLDVKMLGLEQALAIKIFLRDLKEEYNEVDAEVPEWLNVKLKALTEHVKNLVRGAYEEKLKAAVSKQEALQTPEEKRVKIEAEIADLKKKLEG